MISNSFLYLNVLLEKLQTFPIKYIYTPAGWKKYTPVCFSVIIWIIIIFFLVVFLYFTKIEGILEKKGFKKPHSLGCQ